MSAFIANRFMKRDKRKEKEHYDEELHEGRYHDTRG